MGLLAGGNANAGTFQTTLNLHFPAIDGINKIVLNFSSNLETGTITQTDLTNWSLQLFAGNSLIFSDNIVSGGTVLPGAVGFSTAIEFASEGRQ